MKVHKNIFIAQKLQKISLLKKYFPSEAIPWKKFAKNFDSSSKFLFISIDTNICKEDFAIFFSNIIFNAL